LLQSIVADDLSGATSRTVLAELLLPSPTASGSSFVRKKSTQAERDGVIFSHSFCLPLSPIGVKFMAAWTACSS
jgi:hypothetical protein